MRAKLLLWSNIPLEVTRELNKIRKFLPCALHKIGQVHFMALTLSLFRAIYGRKNLIKIQSRGSNKKGVTVVEMGPHGPNSATFIRMSRATFRREKWSTTTGVGVVMLSWLKLRCCVSPLHEGKRTHLDWPKISEDRWEEGIL